MLTSTMGLACCQIELSGEPGHRARSFLATPGENEVTIQMPDGLWIEADDDGVPDYIEPSAPNDGDGNGDGTPDSEQTHVASLPQQSNDTGRRRT